MRQALRNLSRLFRKRTNKTLRERWEAGREQRRLEAALEYRAAKLKNS